MYEQHKLKHDSTLWFSLLLFLKFNSNKSIFLLLPFIILKVAPKTSADSLDLKAIFLATAFPLPPGKGATPIFKASSESSLWDKAYNTFKIYINF